MGARLNKTFLVALTMLLSTFAFLLVAVSADGGVGPTLGNYPATSLSLSTDTTVTPDAAPTNTTSTNVSTSTNFNGKLEANPTTGVVRVTDAHPAGSYTVTVRAFGGGTSVTQTFMLTVTTPVTCTPVSFAAATTFSTFAPRSVAVGDFNRDGKQDLAVANQLSSNNVAIFLGNGAGSFGAATNFSAGASPISLVVGDFNGDGKQDLAVANNGSGNNDSSVSILLGNGGGAFSAPTNFPVGGSLISSPLDIAVGDFNGDGKQDLVTVNFNSNNVSILLGDGAGSFSPATNYPGGRKVAVGDFNGDGIQDLAVTNSSGVAISLGNGAGGFSAPTNFPTSSPEGVAVGDFNGDGKQDLAVADDINRRVSILLGDGNGHFSAPTSFSTPNTPSVVVVGDFNGDGNQDLAVVNGLVSIFLGNGAGSFSAAINFLVGNPNPGPNPRDIAVGDFNGDGMQDLVTANNNASNLAMLLRNCALTPTPTPTPTPPTLTISGTVLYCTNPVPGPVPNVTLTLTGDTGGSTLSDGSGNYGFSSLVFAGGYTITPSKANRAPGSAGIATQDVIAAQRHFLSLGTPLTGCRLAAADVNGDSAVNTLDVIAIQRFFLGMTIGIANVGKYQFDPAIRTYPRIISDQTAQDYDTLILGDVASPFAE
jgi:hypothetical protein